MLIRREHDSRIASHLEYTVIQHTIDMPPSQSPFSVKRPVCLLFSASISLLRLSLAFVVGGKHSKNHSDHGNRQDYAHDDRPLSLTLWRGNNWGGRGRQRLKRSRLRRCLRWCYVRLS